MHGHLVCWQNPKSLSSAHLQDWIGEKQAVSDNLELLRSRAGHGVVLQDFLGGFGFSSSTFPGDQDEVVVVFRAHDPVGIVRNGVAEEEPKVSFLSIASDLLTNGLIKAGEALASFSKCCRIRRITC